MAFNKTNGGAAIVVTADAQVGKPYSEASPPGSVGDGHYWEPGDATPNRFDCSGLVHYGTTFVGCGVSEGSANEQWIQSLGGRVANDEDLAPGDIGAFLGTENTAGYAGHTGIVQTYDAKTRTGTIVNAYDTARGVCVIPFNRDQLTNDDNGLGVLGFYRPANTLPAAPVPKPTPKPPAPKPSPTPTEDTVIHTVTGKIPANGEVIIDTTIPWANRIAATPQTEDGVKSTSTVRWTNAANNVRLVVRGEANESVAIDVAATA